MEADILIAIGLTKSQAQAYRELVRAGALTPPQLAKRTGESRTAAYMALARLQEVGLAAKQSDTKKQTYEPASPSALDRFITIQRQELAQVEAQYREALPNLLSYYYAHRGRPGVRFYEGDDGLEKIYEDILRTAAPVDVVRTPADEAYFGHVEDRSSLLSRYLDKRAALHIESQLLAPALPGPMAWAARNNERLKRRVTWMPPAAYTAPVEMSVYGNKVSFISFGNEAVGTIIESPQVAEAMRQLYALAQVGARALRGGPGAVLSDDEQSD